MRYAITHSTAEAVRPYLPANYRCVGIDQDDGPLTLIYGQDNAGWTLDDYVIPRLASGLHAATELVAKGSDEARWLEDREWNG